ncbi:MAG: VOC family protein [Cyclobacteriaceae bacterium]
MKKLFIIISLVWLSISGYAQADLMDDLEAYFSAMIVSDIDSSISWYSNALGFEVINKVEFKERGFKQSNLKKGKILIELIELDNAVSPKDAIPDYSSKTRLIGFFKTGFLVSNFDKWMIHLESQNIKFHGQIVTDEKTGKKMAIVKDPDGNRIQIFEK